METNRSEPRIRPLSPAQIQAALARPGRTVFTLRWRPGQRLRIRWHAPYGPPRTGARRRSPASVRPSRAVPRAAVPGRLSCGTPPAANPRTPAPASPVPPRRVHEAWHSLPSARHARRREEVERFGSVVTEKDPATGQVRRVRLSFGRIAGRKVWLDSRPTADGRRIPFGRSREAAEETLAAIRGDLLHADFPASRVLALWRPGTDPHDLVEHHLAEWLAHLDALVAQRRRSPNTVREYRRYARADGFFSFFFGRPLREIRPRELREWHTWLGSQKNRRTGKPLSPATVKHVSDAFRAFLHFLVADEVLEQVPRFPAIPVPRYVPTPISLEQQAAVLEQIPWESRGAFLVAATEALRLSEIRALDLDDAQEGRLRVARSIQGPRLDAPVVDRTKNDSAEWRELWSPALREWIAWRREQATPESLGRGEVALFWNPHARNAAKRWTPGALERTWHRARKAAGVPHVSFQEGTRHTTLTALASELPERVLRAFSRHKDARSLDRYAKPHPSAEDLQRAWSRRDSK